MKRNLFLILVLSLANFWIWRVFGRLPVVGLLIILLSVFLILKLKFRTTTLFLILSFYLVKNNFDTNLLYISPLEVDRVVQRQEYYSEALGWLYRNRLGLYIDHQFLPYFVKYQNNLAFNLDPNQYFFANHPRERVGIEEFGKFPGIYLPVFVVGVGVLLTRKDNGFWFFYYVAAVLVQAFVFPGYELGPVLLFPFLVLTIYLGFTWVIERVK